MQANPGYLPREAKGKRVRVELANGRMGSTDNNPMSPPGWAADTTRWTLLGHPHDVRNFEVIG